MFQIWKKKEKEAEASDKGIFKKLKEGLSQTSSKISGGISDIFTKRKLDAESLEQLEELLISADLGPVTAAKLVKIIAQNRFDKEISDVEIKQALADEVEKILTPVQKTFDANTAKPFVVLMVGVNGAGKTTAIAKMAHQFKSEGKKVMLAAGDTFRAAAVDQLQVWADRLGCHLHFKEEGSDAAALVYEAIDKAIADNTEILLIDTAGRLQNKEGLMAELEKIYKVIKKKLPDAPHQTILVLDATVGQNAHSQIELFKKAVEVSGIIVTKLDGTAKGGVIISLAERFALPVYAIGIGEKLEDLRDFNAKDYARTLMGIE